MSMIIVRELLAEKNLSFKQQLVNVVAKKQFGDLESALDRKYEQLEMILKRKSFTSKRIWYILLEV